MARVKIGFLEVEVAPVTIGAGRRADATWRAVKEASEAITASGASVEPALMEKALGETQAAILKHAHCLLQRGNPNLTIEALEEEFPRDPEAMWECLWAIMEASGFARRAKPGDIPGEA